MITRLEARLQPNIGFTFERAPYSRFYRFSVNQISRNLNTTSSVGVAMNPFGTELLKIFP